MEDLPIDLKICVLGAADDFPTLYNLIRTSTSMNSAFNVSRCSTLTQILKRQVDPLLLPDVLAVLRSKELHTHDYDTVVEFLDTEWCGGEPLSYPTPDSPDFARILRFQRIIETLTQDFCDMAEKPRPSLYFRGLPLSEEERMRISRAFYRLELFSNLFRPYEDEELQFSVEDIRTEFLDRIPPWEVEELASIHEYLALKISREFPACLLREIEGVEVNFKGDLAGIDNPKLLDLGRRNTGKLNTNAHGVLLNRLTNFQS